MPGGVAQQDGRLIPGDRLVYVNDVNLENASLDYAVQGKVESMLNSFLRSPLLTTSIIRSLQC